MGCGALTPEQHRAIYAQIKGELPRLLIAGKRHRCLEGQRWPDAVESAGDYGFGVIEVPIFRLQRNMCRLAGESCQVFGQNPVGTGIGRNLDARFAGELRKPHAEIGTGFPAEQTQPKIAPGLKIQNRMTFIVSRDRIAEPAASGGFCDAVIEAERGNAREYRIRMAGCLSAHVLCWNCWIVHSAWRPRSAISNPPAGIG